MVLHSQHGQLLDFHFPISVLKTLAVSKSLNSDSTSSHMNGLGYDVVPCPLKTSFVFATKNSDGFRIF